VTGARWEDGPADEIAHIRRSLLKTSDYMFVDAMKLLATQDYCSPTILQELRRTPSMRARMKKVGFFPWPPDEKRNLDKARPTRATEVLTKFGIEIRKGTSVLPRFVHVGPRRSSGREIRLDRAALFDRVWSEPVDTLAKEWGLSGNGLAKACRRLQIPVPPRGFWVKVQHGQQIRRPRLPELKPGEAEEIVIWVPK
jgi:hypothetical protein